MQRTISLNGREYELVIGSLAQARLYVDALPWGHEDEKRTIKEEFDKLIIRLKDDEPIGGVYLNGERI